MYKRQVWGSPGCGKTVTAVKIAKHLASQKKNVALLLCDMTAPMMPCICPPSELECDKSLGSIFAAQRISVNLIKHNLTTHKKLSYLTMLCLLYTSKSKLLWLIHKLSPSRYSRFIDVFGGSGTVTLSRPIQQLSLIHI